MPLVKLGSLFGGKKKKKKNQTMSETKLGSFSSGNTVTNNFESPETWLDTAFKVVSIASGVVYLTTSVVYVAGKLMAVAEPTAEDDD